MVPESPSSNRLGWEETYLSLFTNFTKIPPRHMQILEMVTEMETEV
jgi:hypothetical protein